MYIYKLNSQLKLELSKEKSEKNTPANQPLAYKVPTQSFSLFMLQNTNTSALRLSAVLKIGNTISNRRMINDHGIGSSEKPERDACSQRNCHKDHTIKTERRKI